MGFPDRASIVLNRDESPGVYQCQGRFGPGSSRNCDACWAMRENEAGWTKSRKARISKQRWDGYDIC